MLARMLSSRPAGGRDPRIDILRGIAILLVILYHINNLIIFPGGYGLTRGADGVAHLPTGSMFLRALFLPFHLGRIGVNLFFVISGLCIHMRLAHQRAATADPPFSLRTFFARRFFRIYPVYWMALAIGIFIAPALYKAAHTPGAPEFQSGPVLGDSLAHLLMLHTFFKPYIMSIISPFWSIGTEEQFYLLYPLVFVLIGRRVALPKIVLGLFFVSVAWRLAFVLSNPVPATFYDGPFLVWVFGFSIPRYFEWSLGALLAWALASGKTLAFVLPGRAGTLIGSRPKTAIALGLGVVVVGVASMARAQTKYMIEDPCYSAGWFLIVAAVLLPAAGAASATPVHAPVANGKMSGWIVWIAKRLEGLGRRSFSVYLLHEVVLITFGGLQQRLHLSPAVTAPAAFATILVVCYPFYRYVEAPFERRSKMLGARPEPAVLLISPDPQT
jgi:peptidoglycan/LPS O-acetylase OafA/YrhL